MAEVTKVFEFNIDMKREDVNRAFRVVSGDTGTYLKIHLLDDGTPVDLTGCFVQVVFSVPNAGVRFQDSNENGGVTLDENEITVRVFSSSIAPGRVECEIQVYSGEDNSVLVTSARFNFDCENPIFNDDSIESTDEYSVLTRLIQQVTELSLRVGDMVKAVYDTDGNGIVDNAEKLGGFLPDYFASIAALTSAVAAITPSSIGAWPVGALHASQHISGASDPVHPQAIGAATTATYTAALPASGWTADAPYTQTVAVEGLYETDNALADVVLTSGLEADELVAYGYISLMATADGALTATCLTDKPETDLNIQLKVVR